MHTLHMIEVSPGKRVSAVRNVRAARDTLGDKSGSGLRNSLAAVDSLLAEPETPVLIGSHTDSALIQRAAKQIERDGVARALIDCAPEQMRRPTVEVRSTDTEADFSAEAYATAMTLMALLQGNPSAALMAANQLMHSTGDAEFFDEVGDVLLAVFPGPTE